MTELNLDLHRNQIPIFESLAKVKVVCCGRRFGKTVFAGNAVVMKAFTKPNSMSWIVSPRYAQTMIMWRKVNKLIPKDYITDSSKGDFWIELENGSMVFAKSADNPDSLVGEGLDLCVIDEAARVKPEAWEVSLQPTLLDSDGDAIMLSTPKGKNWFYTEYLKGLNPMDFPEYESFHFSSYDNPFLKKELIDRKKKTMTWLFFRQEILAEFVDDGGEVFTGIDACIYDCSRTDPIPGREYIMGVDLAKYEDYTVIYVIDVETRKVVWFKRLPHMDWNPQKDIIEHAHHKWNDAPMLIDATGVGDPIVEDLEKRCIDVVPYKFSGNTLKKQVIEGLQVAFQNREIFIPRDQVLLGELGAYSYDRLPSGLFRYSAPPGFHDDCFVKGTLILTPSGQTPIERLGVGDYVITRNGARRIVATRNRVATVIDRYGLTGTPEHPIITKDGTEQLLNTRDNTITYIWNPKSSCIQESRIGDIRTQTDGSFEYITGITENGKKHHKPSTEDCGKTSTGKSQKVVSSITKMTTPLIIPLKTLSVLRGENTHQCTQVPQKEENNPVTNLKKHGLWENLKSQDSCVNDVDVHSPGLVKTRDGVHRVVTRNTCESQENPKNIVKGTERKERVYNIQVEEDPEYFANGILVHNCVIALSLAVYGLEKEYGSRVVGTMAPFYETDEQSEQLPKSINLEHTRFLEPFKVEYDDSESIADYLDD